mgnify:CR=1 FL=1
MLGLEQIFNCIKSEKLTMLEFLDEMDKREKAIRQDTLNMMDIQNLLNRAKSIMSVFAINPEDSEYIEKGVLELIADEWSDNEIRRYIGCWEEVNPDLEENVACRRMDKICDEVRERLGRPLASDSRRVKSSFKEHDGN